MKVDVQERCSDCKLTYHDNYGRVNVTLVFDNKNKYLVVIKSNQNKSHRQLVFYNDFILSSEW